MKPAIESRNGSLELEKTNGGALVTKFHRAIFTLALTLLISACGSDRSLTNAPADPNLWHGGTENVSCVEQGGKFIFLNGTEFCPANGYYCVMPGELIPCD